MNLDNNYAYDAEGRLIKDVQEEIASIEWRVDGKVKAINRTNGSSKKNLKFDYDAMGHRIAKHILTSGNVLEKSTYYVLDAQGNVMSTYVREIISSTVYYSQKERYIYGSSRLGVMNDSIPLYASQNNTYSQTTWTHGIGKRNYELSNHLGNVLSVISDKVIEHGTGGATTPGTVVDYFLTDILQSTDYSAFGVQLQGRNFTKTGISKKYKMGYQGSEMDNEVKSGSDGLATGNSYTTEFRQLDPRLGRWLSIDPLNAQTPWQSPYNSMDNNPIALNDVAGLSTDDPIKDIISSLGKAVTKASNDSKNIFISGNGLTENQAKNLDLVSFTVKRTLRSKIRSSLRENFGWDLSNDESELNDENRSFIALVNDPNGASGYGHNAILIGNDQEGWHFISKEGRDDNDGDEFGGGKAAPIASAHYDKLSDFAGDKKYDNYKNMSVFEIDPTKQKSAERVMMKAAGSHYHFYYSNCGHACIKAMKAGGLIELVGATIVSTTSSGNITVNREAIEPIPNSQYESLKQLNKDKLILKKKI